MTKKRGWNDTGRVAGKTVGNGFPFPVFAGTSFTGMTHPYLYGEKLHF
ncbi:MAG: hypothetical protein SNJ64_01700 [Endomicrobiia bacterium]